MIKKIKTYPYIEINYTDKFVEIESNIQLSIILHIDKNTQNDITYNGAEIQCFDDTFKIDYVSNIKGIKAGTCLVKATYNYNGQILFDEEEFLCYSSFFSNMENLYSLIPSIDFNSIVPYNLLEYRDSVLFPMFQTLLEYVDILYAYQNDAKNVKNPFSVKSRFLHNMFNSYNMPYLIRNIKDVGANKYKNLEQIYRTILDKSLEIIQHRGTKMAYELFLNAIGFDVEMFEFWFDGENLVEINPVDDEASTFVTYDLYGKPIDLQKYNDPRITNGKKTNFIKVKVSNGDTTLITNSQVKQILEWLKPLHIEYLTEVITILINENSDDEQLFELNDTLIDFSLFDGDTNSDDVDDSSKFFESTHFTQKFKSTTDSYASVSNVSNINLKLNSQTSYVFGYINSNGSIELNIIMSKSNFIPTASIISNINMLSQEINIEFDSTTEYEMWHGIPADLTPPSNYKVLSEDDRLFWYDIVDGEAKHYFGDEEENTSWGDYTLGQKPRGEFLFGLNNDLTTKNFSNEEQPDGTLFGFSVTTPYYTEDVFQTFISYDESKIMYDVGERYDTVRFLSSNDSDFKIIQFSNSEVENYYLNKKDSIAQLEIETDEEYEEKIKEYVLDYYKNQTVINQTNMTLGLHKKILELKINLI